MTTTTNRLQSGTGTALEQNSRAVNQVQVRLNRVYTGRADADGKVVSSAKSYVSPLLSSSNVVERSVQIAAGIDTKSGYKSDPGGTPESTGTSESTPPSPMRVPLPVG